MPWTALSRCPPLFDATLQAHYESTDSCSKVVENSLKVCEITLVTATQMT